MKKINYICKHCGFVEIEKPTVKSEIFRVIKALGKGYSIVCSIFFTILIISMLIQPMNVRVLVGSIISAEYTLKARADDFNIREIAINLTKGCNMDEMCYINKVFEKLTTFDYVTGKAFTPKETWNQKAFDCDGASLLFASILNQVDIPTSVLCAKNHCWNIVNTDDGKVLVDVVNDIILTDKEDINNYLEIILN